MESLQGHLLIASPRLMDPNFARSVVLIVQHNESGAMGLILNRPLDVNVQTVWEQVSETPCFLDEPMHQGGPCEGPLMVLHDDAKLSQISVIPGVNWSTEKEALEQLVVQNNGSMKFFVGYAGWGAGQLEGELETGSWLTVAANEEMVFSESEDQWEQLRRRLTLTSTYPWLDPRLIPDDPTAN
jgi:putative transcriptional regulator